MKNALLALYFLGISSYAVHKDQITTGEYLIIVLLILILQVILSKWR